MSHLYSDRRTVFEATPTISTGLYTAGDALGGLITLNAAAKNKGQGGFITGLSLMMKDASEIPLVDVLFFHELITGGTDNDALDISDDDMKKLAGIVSFIAADYIEALVSNRAAYKEITMAFLCAAESTSIYAQMVVRDGPTFAATDGIVFQASILAD